MNRRHVLGLLGTSLPIAGCTSSEPGTPDSASTGTPEAATATPTETCTEVETDFEKPSLSKPESLSAESAKQAAFQIEKAYQETIDISPDDFTEVRGHRENSFDYRLLDSSSTELQSGYQVEVRALVSWTEVRETGNETAQETHYDRPLRVAMYEVTNQWVHRRSGVGDLEGTILCW